VNDLFIDWSAKLGISPFYKAHKISFGDICAGKLQDIDYNFTLLARHYLISFRGIKLLSLTGHRIYYSYRIDAYEVFVVRQVF
jgi:hypothetical protein